MAPHLFFIDEYSSSKQNGIGTFRDLLIQYLKKSHIIDITLISLNADINDLECISRYYGVELALPPVGKGNWRKYGSIIWPLLKLYIDDSTDNIFMFNHSPCSDFIRALKKTFPLSHTIFIIHDQGWCYPLLGNYRYFSLIQKGVSPKYISAPMIDNIIYYFKQEQDIYNIVDRVVCLSQATEFLLKKNYKISKDKIYKIYKGYPYRSDNRISKKLARKYLGIKANEILLLCVGRPSLNKGIEPLLRALNEICKSIDNIKCVLVGEINGYMNFKLTSRSQPSHLIFTGKLPKRDLQLWYKAADIGIIPSFYEQCSFVALEMMKNKLTIVSSDGNGLNEMFINGKNSYVAHISSGRNMREYTRNLYKALKMAINTPEIEKQKMKSYNYQLLKSKYSIEGMVTKYFRLFSSLVRKNESDFPINTRV